MASPVTAKARAVFCGSEPFGRFSAFFYVGHKLPVKSHAEHILGRAKLPGTLHLGKRLAGL